MTIISDALPLVRPASQLYHHLGFWHGRFGQVVHTALDRRLAAANITVSQWSVMILLYHREADTVRDIARIIDLDAGAVTRLADRLEKKGYLRRTPDLSDRRSVFLSLTGSGRRLVPDLAAAVDENDQSFFGVLNHDEVLQYQGILGKLLRAADISPPAGWR
jgi:DNA-binding MarR family transcriptional regulator